MKAVIFAAAFFAGASGWLLLETDQADKVTMIQAVTPESSASLRHRYRVAAAACKDQNKPERSACQRSARDSVLGTVRRDAAQISALH